MNPQTGDVLAMYSNPSYNLNEAESLEGYSETRSRQSRQAALNRATREFYIPGSTFKTFTMISAFRAGNEEYGSARQTRARMLHAVSKVRDRFAMPAEAATPAATFR